MSSIEKAIVIGGGIAGPACALALRKAGIASTVYEAHASTAEGVGGALSVAPNGLQALSVIDVDLHDIGQPNQRQVIADASGKKLMEFTGIPGLPPSRVLWRHELYRAVQDRAQS